MALQKNARCRKPKASISKTRKKTTSRYDSLLQKEIQALKYEVQKYRFQLDVIRRNSIKLTSVTSLERALDTLVSTAATFFSADAVACLLWDHYQNNLVFRAGFGFKSNVTRIHTVPGERLKAMIQSGCEYLVAEDFQVTPFANQNLANQEELVSLLAVVLRFGDRMLGMINIYSRNRIRQFSQEEIENARIFAQQAAVVVRNANLYGELLEEAQLAKTLLQVAEDVGTISTLDEVIKRIVINITRALNFKECVVFLWDEERQVYIPAKAVGLPPFRIPLFQTLVLRKAELNFSETEMKQREVIFALQAERRFPMEKFNQVLMERDFCIVPLVTKGKLLGALVCAGYKGQETFGGKNLILLRGIAAQAAIAIDDAHLFEALEGAFWDIIKSLAAAIEVKDHYTHSHSQSVIFYGSAMAKKMNLPAKDLDLLGKACLLHDLGKIGVDDSILRKVTPLTHSERRSIEMHPVIGAEILGSVHSLAEVAKIVRHHHEHYDGNGYPDHLQGEQIPLLSRILQAADSFDAMTSDRPYRKALTREQAIEQLKTCSGKQFDPQIVTIFLQILNDNTQKWDTMEPPGHARGTSLDLATS